MHFVTGGGPCTPSLPRAFLGDGIVSCGGAGGGRTKDSMSSSRRSSRSTSSGRVRSRCRSSCSTGSRQHNGNSINSSLHFLFHYPYIKSLPGRRRSSSSGHSSWRSSSSSSTATATTSGYDEVTCIAIPTRALTAALLPLQLCRHSVPSFPTGQPHAYVILLHVLTLQT